MAGGSIALVSTAVLSLRKRRDFLWIRHVALVDSLYQSSAIDLKAEVRTKRLMAVKCNMRARARARVCVSCHRSEVARKIFISRAKVKIVRTLSKIYSNRFVLVKVYTGEILI